MDARARVALPRGAGGGGWAVARWLPELGERLALRADHRQSRSHRDELPLPRSVEAARFFWSHKLGGLGTASFAGDSYGGV
jgi:hypothetical protein